MKTATIVKSLTSDCSLSVVSERNLATESSVCRNFQSLHNCYHAIYKSMYVVVLNKMRTHTSHGPSPISISTTLKKNSEFPNIFRTTKSKQKDSVITCWGSLCSGVPLLVEEVQQHFDDLCLSKFENF